GGIPRGTAVLLCGPPAMVAALAAQARAAGVPKAAIFQEAFTLL
ncbi:oxidoreductase, partial [Candidatus Parcubacteria bacterium]